MDEKKAGGRRRASAAGVVLGLALSLILAGAAVWGLHIWGQGHFIQPSETEPEVLQANRLSVYVPEAPYTAEAAEPDEAEPEAADGGYEYEEILVQEDGFLLARIQGKRYLGYLAVVDDPFRVTVPPAARFRKMPMGNGWMKWPTPQGRSWR